MEAMNVYEGMDKRFHSCLTSGLFCDKRSASFPGSLTLGGLGSGVVALLSLLGPTLQCTREEEGGGS